MIYRKAPSDEKFHINVTITTQNESFQQNLKSYSSILIIGII